MSDSKIIDVSKEIESLVQKAEKAEKSDDALKFSQAACNSANAMACLFSVHEEMRKLLA